MKLNKRQMEEKRKKAISSHILISEFSIFLKKNQQQSSIFLEIFFVSVNFVFMILLILIFIYLPADDRHGDQVHALQHRVALQRR